MQKDKILHFSACAVITFLTISIFFIINTSFCIAALAGMLTSTAAAWGKEYGDKVNPHNKWDWKDILADSIGTLAGVLLGGILWLI